MHLRRRWYRIMWSHDILTRIDVHTYKEIHIEMKMSKKTINIHKHKHIKTHYKNAQKLESR